MLGQENSTKVDVETVLEMLSRQTFADWYADRFERFLSDNEPVKEEILADLEKMLRKSTR